jgi:hypothetical protein
MHEILYELVRNYLNGCAGERRRECWWVKICGGGGEGLRVLLGWGVTGGRVLDFGRFEIK